jgi:hypothetical protein
MNLLAFAFHTVCDCLEALWAKARLAKRARTRFFEHANNHGLSGLSRLANPHDNPHHLKTAAGNRKTKLGPITPGEMDLELVARERRS